MKSEWSVTNYKNEKFTMTKFLMLHKENDNVLYLCTGWNKISCAFGETTTPSLQTATQIKIIYQWRRNSASGWAVSHSSNTARLIWHAEFKRAHLIQGFVWLGNLPVLFAVCAVSRGRYIVISHAE
jgi:hypothetical protein